MVAPRLALPRFVQLGRAETLSLGLYAAGQLVAPAGGTYSLLDGTGAAVVDEAAVTVTDSVATYALPSTFADGYTVPQLPWRERWHLTGLTGAHTVLDLEQEVHVCRVAPARHVTVEDLYRLHPQWRRQLPSARDTLDEPIDVAWEYLVRRLLSDGHLPHRVLDWWRLSTIHTLLAAAIVCRDFQTDARGDSRWERLGTDYERRAWADYGAYLGLRLDEDEDGLADDPTTLQGASRPVWLG